MKSAGKARNDGLYRHIRTSKEIIRNLLNDFYNILHESYDGGCQADQQNNSCDNQQRNYRIVKSCIRNHSSKG